MSGPGPGRTPLVIRPAEERDVPVCAEVERAAGEVFRSIGMAAVADDDPPAPDVYAAHVRDGRAWVATDASDRAVAYVLASVVDGEGHVEQVSVHPRCSGRGIGRALLERVDAWAWQRAMTATTLTTFAEVPWNAPYYRRLGFHEIAARSWGPELAAVRASEAACGLDRWPRVAMRRHLTG